MGVGDGAITAMRRPVASPTPYPWRSPHSDATVARSRGHRRLNVLWLLAEPCRMSGGRIE